MAKTRKQYSPEFKLKAVIEILKGEKTASQIAGELGTLSKTQSFRAGIQGAKIALYYVSFTCDFPFS